MNTSRLIGMLAVASALSVAPALAKGPSTASAAKKAHPDITQPATSSGPKVDPVGGGRVLDPPGGGLHNDHILVPSRSSGPNVVSNGSSGRVLDPPGGGVGNPDHILAPQSASGPRSAPNTQSGHVFRVIPPPPQSNSGPTQR